MPGERLPREERCIATPSAGQKGLPGLAPGFLPGPGKRHAPRTYLDAMGSIAWQQEPLVVVGGLARTCPEGFLE